MTHRWVLPLLILSGFAGLAYELLWVRLLGLHLGSTTISFSVVLGVFFAGLAAGSRWAGKRSLSVRQPLKAYALLEAATGLLGLLLYPVLTHLGPLVARLDPGTGTPALLFRLAVAAVVLTPPTFLMGATLPFISVATIRADEETGRGVSLVYGFNTAGACLGAYGLTFWLLPNLGVLGATLVTVGINAFVAGIVLFVMRSRTDAPAAQPTPETEAGKHDDVDPKTRAAVMTAAFLGGLVATSVQVVWARFFTILLGGTSYGIGSVLVSVLIGIAVGSFVAARALRRSTHLGLTAVMFVGATALGIAAFAATAPLQAYLAATGPNAGLTGSSLHHVDLALVLVGLAVPTIASGGSLPALTAVLERSAARSGHSLAVLYAANTFGCILGSLTTGLVLLPALGSATTMYLMFLLLVVAVVVLVTAQCRDRLAPAMAAFALLLACAAFFPQIDMRPLSPRSAARADYFSFRQQLDRVNASTGSFFEGDVASVRVANIGSARGLTLNGLGQGTRYQTPPEVAFESVLVATVPWQHAKRRDRGLVVGLGAGGTAHVLLELGVKRLEVAELEAGVVDAVNEIWGTDSPLNDERLQLVRNDARNHLLTQSRREPKAYDFVTSMPAHPWVASALFTKEFFQLASDNLADEGVFATWFGPHEMPDESIEGLFGAFTSVFPHYLVYFVPEASAFYLVGSRSPLRFDVAQIAALSQSSVYRGINPQKFSPTFFSSRLTAYSGPVPVTTKYVSTDDNGLIEFGVQRPRAKPVLDALEYLPHRGLSPALIDGAESDGFLLDTIETLLSTPQGRLPHAAGTAASAIRLAGTLRESKPLLAQYALARAALMTGKRAEAVKLATGLSPHLAARLAKFLAGSETDEAKRLTGLRSLERTVDVRAELIALGEPDDDTPAGAGDDDALGLLFRTEAEWRAAAPDSAATDIRRLVDRLVAFNEPKLFESCASRFERAGLAGPASQCRTFILTARQSSSRRLVARALEAGATERWADALVLLKRADAMAPLDGDRTKLLLQTAVKLGTPDVVTEARLFLISRGYEPASVDGLIESYRNDKAP